MYYLWYAYQYVLYIVIFLMNFLTNFLTYNLLTIASFRVGVPLILFFTTNNCCISPLWESIGEDQNKSLHSRLRDRVFVHSLLSFYTLLYKLKKTVKRNMPTCCSSFWYIRSTYLDLAGLWQKFDCQCSVLPSKSTEVIQLMALCCTINFAN